MFRYSGKTLQVLGFLVGLGIYACSGEPPETEPAAISSPETIDSLVGVHFDNTEHPEIRRAEYALNNPLGVSQPNALAAYTQKLTGCRTSRSAVPNRHDTTVVDTTVTLTCSGAVLQLYQVTGARKVILLRAEVTQADHKLGGGFFVGMSASEATELSRGLWLYSWQTNRRIWVEDPLTGSKLTAFLRNGRVSKLLYEGYLD